MKSLGILSLALKNIRERPLRSGGLALMVAIFSFTMFGGGLLSESIRNGMDSLSRRLGADILVVPHGYDKKLQAALLRGEPSSFYVKGDLADKLREVPGVEKAAAQLYLATLNASCCTLPIQIIAYDPESDFVVQPWVARSLATAPKDDEVVVGDKITGDIGSELSLFGRTYRIAARLDGTGMGFDTTVFMTMKNARRLLAALKGEKPAGFEPGSVSSIMVAVAPGQDLKAVANGILGRFALDYNLDIVVSKNMISDIAKKLGGLALLMRVLTCAFWVVAAGVLCLFFSVLMNERKREFSLFRVMGATRGRLVRMVLCEAIVISLAGGAAGVIAALSLTLPFHGLISGMLQLPYLALSVSAVAAMAALSMVLATAAGPLASLYSVYRIGTGDAYLTMRSGE